MIRAMPMVLIWSPPSIRLLTTSCFLILPRPSILFQSAASQA